MPVSGSHSHRYSPRMAVALSNLKPCRSEKVVQQRMLLPEEEWDASQADDHFTTISLEDLGS